MHTEDYTEQNLLKGFPLPAVPESLPKIVTLEQFTTLLSHINKSTPQGLKHYCILLILYDNGMRISEVINIRISDIDFQDKTIKVIGKGQRERLVPITVYTRKQIRRYIEEARDKICLKNTPYLFACQDGEPISSNSVQQYMRRLLVKSGLRVKFSPHILRHSFATQYLANGGNVFYLKAILGHKSLQMTLRYTRILPQDIQDQHMQYSPVAALFKHW